jgi:hypothetical protein
MAFIISVNFVTLKLSNNELYLGAYKYSRFNDQLSVIVVLHDFNI